MKQKRQIKIAPEELVSELGKILKSFDARTGPRMKMSLIFSRGGNRDYRQGLPEKAEGT